MLVPQIFDALTDNLPEVVVPEKFTSTEFVTPIIVAPDPE